MNQTWTNQVIAVLQASSESLVKENWLEVWSLRLNNTAPVSIHVRHVIDPCSNGSIKVRSTVSYGVRVSHHLDADVQEADVQEARNASPFKVPSDAAIASTNGDSRDVVVARS